LLIASIVVGSVVCIALVTVQIVHWKQSASHGSDGDPDQTDEAGKKLNKREYTDASRKALTIAGVTVRIDKVSVGRIDYRSKGEILQSATPHYLVVNINVKNKSRGEPVKFQSWYDHEFEDDEGHHQDVELQDDNGVHWQVFRVPGAENVERHVKSDAQLPPGDDLTDSLVFKLPDVYIDEPIPPLYLKLPAAAIGDSGVYRMHLPSIMIDRRDK
jgi:hypothetical protein